MLAAIHQRLMSPSSPLETAVSLTLFLIPIHHQCLALLSITSLLSWLFPPASPCLYRYRSSSGVVLISYDGEPPSSGFQFSRRRSVESISDIRDHQPDLDVERMNLDNIWLYLPLREQTCDEKARTRQFAREVVELLRNYPRWMM